MNNNNPGPTITSERNDAFSERDAARYLGYRPITLRAWRREGRGPAYVRAGRSVRYRLADLDAWLHAHRVETRESRRAVEAA